MNQMNKEKVWSQQIACSYTTKVIICAAMAHACEDLSKWQDYIVDFDPAITVTSEESPAQGRADRVVNEPPTDFQADHAVQESPAQEDAKADDVVNELPPDDAKVDHVVEESDSAKPNHVVDESLTDPKADRAVQESPAQEDAKADDVVNELPPDDAKVDHVVEESDNAKPDDVVDESLTDPKADHAMQEPPGHEDPRAVDNQSVVSDASWEMVECAPVGNNPPIDQRSFPRPGKNLVAVLMGVLSVGMAGMAATAHSMCGSIDPTMQGAKVEIMKKNRSIWNVTWLL